MFFWYFITYYGMYFAVKPVTKKTIMKKVRLYGVFWDVLLQALSSVTLSGGNCLSVASFSATSAARHRACQGIPSSDGKANQPERVRR